MSKLGMAYLLNKDDLGNFKKRKTRRTFKGLIYFAVYIPLPK